MTSQEILNTLAAAVISGLGYFLKRTMNDLDKVKEQAANTHTKVEVLETKYITKIEHFDDKMDMLYTAIDKLTAKIDKLQDKI